MIRRDSFLPTDIDNIILNHHELPDGKGYPRGLSSMQISPISCIFILAEKISISMIRNGVRYVSQEEFIDSLEIYNHGNFKKPLAGLLLLL